MSSAKPSLLSIAIALGVLYVVWGSTYLAIRVAVETMPPFLMASARFAVAGILMVIVVHWTRGFEATPRQWFDNSIAGFLMLVGGNGLVSWAEQKIPSGIATLIISANPIFFVLGEWTLTKFSRGDTKGDRPSWLTMVGLTIGFAGLWILINPGFVATEQTNLEPWSVAALLTACISWTVGSLFSRYTKKPAEAFTAASMQMICASVWLFLVSCIAGELYGFKIQAVSKGSWAALIYLIIAGSLIGFSSFVWLMKHCSPTVVSTYAYVNPIVAVLLGWWLLNEELGPQVFYASIAIIFGVAIVSLSKAYKRGA